MTSTVPPQPPTARTWAFRALSVLVTVGLMALVLAFVDWSAFGQIIGRISAAALGVALLAYLAQNVFRALRFRVLLNRPDAPLRLLIPITLNHNFLVRVLPFKLGELSYLLLVRRRLGYSLESSVSSLIGARLFELLIVVLTCATGIILSGDALAAQRDVLVILIVVSFAVSVVALYYAGKLIRWLSPVVRWIVALVAVGAAAALHSRMLRLAGEFDTLRQPRPFILSLLLSVGTNACSIALNIVLMSAAGVDASLPQFLAIIGLGQFAMAFPFSISGFGVVEGSWALGLVTFAGMSSGQAAAVGILLHSFQVIAATLYGAAGYLYLRVSGRG